MQCKLFDFAAFGCGATVPDGYERAEELVKFAHKNLVRCTLLDARSFLLPWCDWLRRRGNDIKDEFSKVTSPWDCCFVYAGAVSPNAMWEFGVEVLQQRLSDKTKAAILDSTTKADRFKAAVHRATIYMDLFVWKRPQHGGRVGVSHLVSVLLDECGRYLAGCVKVSSDSNKPEFTDLWYSFALFAFQLMHCRNIVTQKHDPYRPRMPKGLRNKSPKITYHTLAISDTLVKRDGVTATGEHPGVSKHICRGNFAHYTEDKPLFGKYTGTFWRPMHIKGSAQHGIAGKDYVMGENHG